MQWLAQDINVYQAQESLENRSLAPSRRVVILAAECRRASARQSRSGPGHKSVNEIEQALRDHFELGGHKAYAMARLTAEHRVVLLSLPAETVRPGV